ncbi:MAG: cysteine desulfurase [Candidatus Zixiibacteriota bacterium]|nr:MAG: cysteine desulfurase [candidate division Zixibacteria bacterium]
MQTEKFVYFDNINTTFPDPRVVRKIDEVLNFRLGNPSAHIHSAGIAAGKVVDEAREKVAAYIGAAPETLIFTSGATEANNLAITGFLKANPEFGFVCSNIEHFSVLNQIRSLRNSVKTSILDVDSYGLVEPDSLEKVLKNNRSIVSLSLANPEIGTMQDIEKISEICSRNGSILHSDATAAAGLIEIDVNKMGIDLLTLSGHNIYGPAGVGALYVNKKIRLASIFEGGNQESGIRPGTENVPGIAGMGEACEALKGDMKSHEKRLRDLGNDLWKSLQESVRFVNFTGHPEKRLPGHVSFWVEHIEGESLLLLLSMNGVMASSGSACSSNLKAKDEDELMASHVLAAVGVPSDICSGSITLSAGRYNTEEDFNYVKSVLPGLVEKLLTMSPSYDDYMKNKETTDG